VFCSGGGFALALFGFDTIPCLLIYSSSLFAICTRGYCVPETKCQFSLLFFLTMPACSSFLSLQDVETSIADYAAKAKSGSLAMEDMVGGTFTISNGGVFGSLYGTPIINMPQAAILGMHATKMRPMVVNGAVVPRPMMCVWALESLIEWK